MSRYGQEFTEKPAVSFKILNQLVHRIKHKHNLVNAGGWRFAPKLTVYALSIFDKGGGGGGQSLKTV